MSNGFDNSVCGQYQFSLFSSRHGCWDYLFLLRGKPLRTLGITYSACTSCRQLIPAKIVSIDGDVYFDKFCPEHGSSRTLVRRDTRNYLETLRYVKPAWIPEVFSGGSGGGCPGDCGFCQLHEQHLCMPIVEITSRCDLACPACLVDAGEPRDMSLKEFTRLLDRLIATERQIDILNLSGGEPLMHPRLLALLDEALTRPEIVRVSISTNGLALLERSDYLLELSKRSVVVSLQFDGFGAKAYEILRGRSLLSEKLRILDLLREANITTSLTMTVAGGLNDDQFPEVLQYFFAQPHIASLMIQPLAFVGRGERLRGIVTRSTIPDIIKKLSESGLPQVLAEDFSPLPCSHPLCFTLAFYLMLDGGGMASLNRLIDAARWLDALANRTVFGLDQEEHEQMKDMIYELWSGPVGAAPDSEAILPTLRRILDELARRRFDPREAFSITERRVKSIFLHAFQDAETFDLARARRCCNAYPQSDGRLLPACMRNVLGCASSGVKKPA